MSRQPASTAGWLATTPTVAPPMRAKPTRMLRAWSGWISNREASSTTAVTTACMSYACSAAGRVRGERSEGWGRSAALDPDPAGQLALPSPGRASGAWEPTAATLQPPPAVKKAQQDKLPPPRTSASAAGTAWSKKGTSRSTGSQHSTRGAPPRFDPGSSATSSRTAASASSSQAYAPAATPDRVACTAAPPSSSCVTASPVTLRTTSGPVRNM